MAWAAHPQLRTTPPRPLREIAEQQYGGRVLKVEREEGAYRVKLLQPSGKVKIVRVPDSDRDPDRDPDRNGGGAGSKESEDSGRGNRD
ncbi:MAG: hypothetical protein JRG96_21285 [Deltaproteobacteria bacterium]|nr:hypothetical protein [Deltaproteobacteria bacterium]